MAKSQAYMLYELRDNIPEGISKNKELLEIEDEFKKVIEESGKYEKFAFMLSDWETEKKQLEKSIKGMESQLEAVNMLIKMLEAHTDDSQLVDMVINLMFKALGVKGSETEEKTN